VVTISERLPAQPCSMHEKPVRLLDRLSIGTYIELRRLLNERRESMSQRFVPGVAGMVSLALLRDPAITHAALKTYIALAAYQAGRETNDPSEAALAEYTSLSERSVRRGIEILEQADWVEVRQRGLRLTNVYRVKVDVEEAVGVPSGPDSRVPSGPDSRVPSGPSDRTAVSGPIILSSSPDSSSPEEEERE